MEAQQGREGHTKQYRCRLIRVLPTVGLAVEVIAKRSFLYAGRRYRRGERAVVQAAALGHLLLTKKAELKGLHGTRVEGAIGWTVPRMPMGRAVEHG